MSYIVAGLIGSLVGGISGAYYGIKSNNMLHPIAIPLAMLMYAPIGALIGNFIGLGGIGAYKLISRRLQITIKKRK